MQLNLGGHMIKMLSGDEAVARGAWEAGVAVDSAYPGTLSTEILEDLAHYPNTYAEWAPNKKVAVELPLVMHITGSVPWQP
jgi:indolepyruvate ferredoxin oxidoreductase alpha subunit